MADKPIAGKDVPEALREAVRLAVAGLEHRDLAATVARSWHTVGIIMTDEAKAEAVAKTIVSEADVAAHPTVVRLDTNHVIAGFVSPEILQR